MTQKKKSLFPNGELRKQNRPFAEGENPIADPLDADETNFYEADDKGGQRKIKSLDELEAPANLEALEDLLYSLNEGQMNPNVMENGIAPIHYAALHGFNNCIVPLDNAGADLNAKDAQGDTALHIAAEYGDLKTIQRLIECDADVNILSYDRGQTPLLISLILGNIECVQAFLDAGALLEREHIEGKPDGNQIECIELVNKTFEASIITFG
jgi:hypothetical protein